MAAIYQRTVTPSALQDHPEKTVVDYSAVIDKAISGFGNGVALAGINEEIKGMKLDNKAKENALALKPATPAKPATGQSYTTVANMMLGINENNAYGRRLMLNSTTESGLGLFRNALGGRKQ